MHSGRGSEGEDYVWSWKTQSNADEPCENHSERSSSTCRRHSGITQELVWPSGVRRELPLNTPLSWEKDRSEIDPDTIEIDVDLSSSGNAKNPGNPFRRGSLIDPDAEVKPLRQAGRHHRTYKVNPLSPHAPREALRILKAIRRSFRPAPPSLQFPIVEGAVDFNKFDPTTRKPLLRRPYFNTNGSLPYQHPRWRDMEEQATQKATQPIFNQPQKVNQPMLSEEDEGDVICVLHPASVPACHAVDLIAEATPQHIITRVISEPNNREDKSEDQDNKSEDQDMISEDQDMISEDQDNIPEDQDNILEDQDNIPEDQDNILKYQDNILKYQDSVSENQNKISEGQNSQAGLKYDDLFSSKDIALRLSSRLRNPCMGFVFGREAKICDLMLPEEYELERRISKSHFRMFFNHLGVLMLEDTSTNGTMVNGEVLHAKTDKKKRMIAGGEIIEILLSGHARKCLRFLVTIPTRYNPDNRFAHNLAKYMAWLKQEARRAEALAKAVVDGQPQINPAVVIPFNPLNEPIKDLVPSDKELFDDDLLRWNPAAKKFNYGMEWSGGDRFNVVGHIGRGAFASVFKLATKRDGEYYAAKQIEKRHFMRHNTVDNKIHNEIDIMKRLSHPNIVQFIDHQDERHHLYIIMEFVPGGDLTSFIKAGAAMAECMCQSVAEQICDAVKYLHECNVTHRDIKPDNILVQTRNPFVVKLSDFGLSKWVADEETMLKSFCGTLLYCAPEIYPDYGLYKAGVQGKRARNKHSSLKTSPYKPSVDTWALGAVLYHLLCASPPFRGGSSDDRGSSMLEIVMTSPLDRGRLKNAGVSNEGIDFVSKMLVVDPAGRSTEAEWLKHPWFTKTDHVDTDDVQMEGGASALDSIDGGGSELDASQLSLAENPLDHEIDDSEDGLTTEVDELEGGRESKRFKLGSPRGREGLPTDEISHPHLPGEPTESVYSEAAPPPAITSRLFGEIGASALGSSGVLGYNALAALEMPPERSRDESFDTSESWINDARIISDEGAVSTARHSKGQPGLVSMGAAPSLFGAEALVGQMNMTSLASSGSAAPSPESTFESRQRTSKRRDASAVPAGLVPGSRGSSQVFKSFTDHTNLRTKKFSGSEAHSNPNHSRGASTDEAVGKVGAELDKPGNPRSLVLATAAAQETTSANGGATKVGVGSIVETDTHAQEGRTSQSHHAADVRDDRSISGSDESQVSEGPAREVTSPLTFPKPPPRFGTLTALPGSLCNTTIRLERRITYYGRDPSSHVQHPNMKEIRIPKNALDIIFWRPGIEAMIESGKDWSTLEDLYAIAHTRTSRNIKVNGVKLTKGEGCWNYGRLHTGDVITIFGPAEGEGDQTEGKAAVEFLKFRCEFSLGLSAQQRPADQPRFVVEKEEEKYMQKQIRRSTSVASRDSRSTT